VTALLFLSIAVVISVVGGFVLWIRNRNPTRWDSGISDFSREMRALAPERGTESDQAIPGPSRYGPGEEHGE
jgi:hypothetical protein